jgi:glycosyltransferase involved in cell wall biosynthesis
LNGFDAPVLAKAEGRHEVNGRQRAIAAARLARNWAEVIALAKEDLRRNGVQSGAAAIATIRDIVVALRKLRMIPRVERLARHLAWRHSRGEIDALTHVNLMRAMHCRRFLAGELDRSADQATRVAYIESLVELSDWAKASDLLGKWKIGLWALSPPNRRALKHFQKLQEKFGAASSRDLVEKVVSRLARRPSGKNHPRKPGRARIFVLASSLSVGGSERQLTLLLSFLNSDPTSYEVLLLVMNRSEALLPVDCENIRIVYRDQLEPVNPEQASNVAPKFLLDDVELVLKRPNFRPVLQLAAGFEPDVVFNAVGSPVDALLVGALLPCETIVRFGGMSFFYDGSDRHHILKWVGETLCSAMAKRATLVANSHAAGVTWAERLRLPRKALKVICNGTTFSALHPRSWREAMKWGKFGRSDATVVGFVGRFHDTKRPALWLRIAMHLASRHKDVRFLLVGDGPFRAPLERMVDASDHRNSFLFTGLVTQGVHDLFQTMDVLMLTSSSESHPNVVLEALGHGTFVVAGAVGDVARIVREPHLGRVVPGNDFDGFVSTIETALEDRTAIAAGREARALAIREEFSVDRMWFEYASLFERRLRREGWDASLLESSTTPQQASSERVPL